jgi:nickel-dependent lactate racemase
VRIELPYGRIPYPLDLGTHTATILEAPPPPPARPLGPLLDAALDAPIDRPRVETMVSAGARVTVIVSDATRDEPRGELLTALRRRLPAVRWTIAIATGTHGPAPLDALGLPADLLAEATIVNHDGHHDLLVSLGTTPHGTAVALPRCLLDTDLVIATGCIRPHYFAGFGAGIKAIFPGLGAAKSIRHNHLLKASARSCAGNIDDNPCRSDLEAAVALLPTPTFLLDGVCAIDHRVHAAVAGDPITAFRAGVELARPYFTVRGARASLVIASDSLPVTATLYQAAKIAAATAGLVEPGGTLVIVAECADGIGPLETVNEAIFRLGILPRLAPTTRLCLVSSLDRTSVARTLLEPMDDLERLRADSSKPVTIVPRASQLLIEAHS